MTTITSDQMEKTAPERTKILTFLLVEIIDWRFVTLCAFIMAVLTSSPYLFGYLIAPADRVFMGMTTSDIAQYMAWMRGFTTANLIDNHLTAEPTEPIFFNLLWWFLAKITVILPLSAITTIHLYRLFTVFFFAVMLYWFIGFCLSEQKQRRVAFLIAYFGGGMGWIWVLEKYLVGREDVRFLRDVYVVEANSFMALVGINLFTISASLMILIYISLILAYERRQWGYCLLASLIALVLGWAHPYDLLLIYAIIGMFTLALWLRDGFSWRLILYPTVIGGISVWAAVYSVYITTAYPVWKAVLAQFENAGAWTPDPFHLLILLGLPFLIVLFTFDGFTPLKERSSWDLFVRVWFWTNFFVVYIPFNFQIHYLNGWQVPIAILATMGLFIHIFPWLQRQVLFQWLSQRWSPVYLERSVLGMILLFIIFINIYFLAWRFSVLARLPHQHFLAQDEVAALQWLNENVDKDDTILSDITVGQYIPSRTGARAFLAHWAMTKDIYQKQAMVKSFFSSEAREEERKLLLHTFGIDYIFIGEEETVLGDYDPNKSPYLEPCFSKPRATIYCIIEDQLSSIDSK